MPERPSIPDQVKLKLWALSGARCEFPGCNKYVWRDGLTLKDDNFAHMAHIIAANPGGPRGDEVASPELATDYDNLMLLCFDHSKLVDGKNKCDYTIEYLREYKRSHEDRIRRQTELSPEMTTTVLRFSANIGDRPVEVSTKQAYQAILPRYPADDRGIALDFTNRPGRGKADFWTSFASEISERVEKELRAGNDRSRPSHISVFALGPIPLLVHLGNAIGNTISADLYQRHRDTENWTWKNEAQDDLAYEVKETKGETGGDIAVVLSLSGKIHYDEVYKLFAKKPHLYEITIATPAPGFLASRPKLEKFRLAYRELLTKIRTLHGGGTVIHLFPAIPAPIAVVCGREILPKSDPKMTVYDHENAQGGFIPILTIN
ncbi:MAG TPA: SAVED domain-containing protein [Candidatus Paceibacterota bacterium]|nr:SAVED domain-containing protein [Candidatus Paceibacterota bacterium]